MGARLAFLPAPSRGWNTADPIAEMEQGFAPIIDNMIVENGAPRVRRGFREWASGLPGRVDGLLAWNGAGGTRQLFAASGTGIYSVTAGGAVGSAAVSGLTSARWSGVNFAATGGNFLFAFNGADTPRTFDGTTWATWGGTGVTGGVSWAGALNGRLFVGNESRLSFFYGGAGAIAGAFTEFPLQGVATRGGGVTAMGTISIDGGGGPQTLSVFLTTEGEAIVYAGIDPSSTSTWALVGRWRIPALLGRPHRCIAQYGGDTLALTTLGILPLARLRSGQDVAHVMEREGLTRTISPTWQGIVTERGALSGWSLTPLPALDLIVANAPWSAAAAQQIVLSEREAVSRWTNVQAAVWTEALGGRVFFGDATAGGKVFLYGEDNSDAGMGIRAECMASFSTLRAPGMVKRIPLTQAMTRDNANTTIGLDLMSDFRVPVAVVDALGAAAASPTLPSLPPSGVSLWGTALWGSALWAGASNDVALPWRGSSCFGYAVAPRFSVIGGNSARPAWLGTNLRFDVAAGMR